MHSTQTIYETFISMLHFKLHNKFFMLLYISSYQILDAFEDSILVWCHFTKVLHKEVSLNSKADVIIFFFKDFTSPY